MGVFTSNCKRLHLFVFSSFQKITFNSVTNCLGPRKLVHTGVVYKVRIISVLIILFYV